jgi:iduronate 2-sulfatase
MVGLMGGVLLLAAPLRAEHYEVFLLAGQSNMDGRGLKADLVGDLVKWAKPQPNVLITFRGGGLRRTLTVSHGFHPLEPGFSGAVGTRPKWVPTQTFGPEVSFGGTMAESLGRHVALIKCAEGGTNLQKDWDPNEPDKLYGQWIRFVQQTLKEMKSHRDTYNLAGVVWHQGESDAGLPDGEYQKLLTAFIQRTRTDLKESNLPFVIGEVFDNKGRDRVRAGQKAVSVTVPHTAFASAQGLSTLDKGTHFDAASQIELGKRMAQAMLSLIKPNQ